MIPVRTPLHGTPAKAATPTPHPSPAKTAATASVTTSPLPTNARVQGRLQDQSQSSSEHATRSSPKRKLSQAAISASPQKRAKNEAQETLGAVVPVGNSATPPELALESAPRPTGLIDARYSSVQFVKHELYLMDRWEASPEYRSDFDNLREFFEFCNYAFVDQIAADNYTRTIENCIRAWLEFYDSQMNLTDQAPALIPLMKAAADAGARLEASHAIGQRIFFSSPNLRLIEDYPVLEAAQDQLVAFVRDVSVPVSRSGLENKNAALTAEQAQSLQKIRREWCDWNAAANVLRIAIAEAGEEVITNYREMFEALARANLMTNQIQNMDRTAGRYISPEIRTALTQWNEAQAAQREDSPHFERVYLSLEAAQATQATALFEGKAAASLHVALQARLAAQSVLHSARETILLQGPGFEGDYSSSVAAAQFQLTRAETAYDEVLIWATRARDAHEAMNSFWYEHDQLSTLNSESSDDDEPPAEIFQSEIFFEKVVAHLDEAELALKEIQSVVDIVQGFTNLENRNVEFLKISSNNSRSPATNSKPS